jgi:hypothetical protein
MRIVRERRRRRSENTTLALHYHLETCRTAGRLDGMVLSDEDGFCLAASGDPEACQEVAARLPFIGRKVPQFDGFLFSAESGWRIRMERVTVDGSNLYLCAIGSGKTAPQDPITASRHGVQRILAA